MKDFAEVVKRAVEVTSLRQVAEYCEVSQAAVKRWMTGQYAPMKPVQDYLSPGLQTMSILAEMTQIGQDEWEDWRQINRCC